MCLLSIGYIGESTLVTFVLKIFQRFKLCSKLFPDYWYSLLSLDVELFELCRCVVGYTSGWFSGDGKVCWFSWKSKKKEKKTIVLRENQSCSKLSRCSSRPLTSDLWSRLFHYNFLLCENMSTNVLFQLFQWQIYILFTSVYFNSFSFYTSIHTFLKVQNVNASDTSDLTTYGTSWVSSFSFSSFFTYQICPENPSKGEELNSSLHTGAMMMIMMMSQQGCSKRTWTSRGQHHWHGTMTSHL